jgi:hypothetical protein
MSNNTNNTTPILTVKRVTEQFGPDQGTGVMRFQLDEMSLGATKFDIFTPEDGRAQHLSFDTHGAVLDDVTAYGARDGNVCTTLNLTVRGRTLSVSLWGVTLDALATAVEAAQRS